MPEGVAVDLGPSRRLGRFFRDDEEMAAAADIAVTVERAIENSESLIVVCSPRSAKSKWVAAEIRHFRNTGRGGKVFAVIIDGIPNSGDPETECFPAALRAGVDPDDPLALPIEPLGLDLRKTGRSRACARLAAGLLGVDFDDLWQRDRRRAETRQRAILAASTAVSAAFAVLAGAAIFFGVRANENAQRAQTNLTRFFAERAWQRLAEGDSVAATRYALAGMRLSPENASLLSRGAWRGDAGRRRGPAAAAARESRARRQLLARWQDDRHGQRGWNGETLGGGRRAPASRAQGA